MIPSQGAFPFAAIQWARVFLTSLLGLLTFATPATPLAPPSITLEPDPVSVRAGTRLVLRVRAEGSAPLAYGWSHNSRPIPDATNETYSIEPVTTEHAGIYAVGVTNRYGFVHSRDVAVQVFTPPIFVDQPQPRTVEAGDYFFLHAAAAGTPPIYYAWRRNDTPVADLREANDLVVAPSTPLDDGYYQVIASNRWGTATSAVVRVSVNPAPPNAEFLGRRFVALARTGMAIQGDHEPLGLVARQLGARWLGRELLFSTVRPGLRGRPLLKAGLNGVAVVIPDQAILPNSLGHADGWAIPEGAVSTDPLLVLASTNHSFTEFVGAFRWDGQSLVSLVDLHTPVPDAPQESFKGFSEAVQHGADLALLGYTGQRFGLYLWKNGALRRVLDTTQDLPVAGHQAQGLYALGWDGSTAAVALWSGVVGFVAALQITADGQASAFLEAGDLLPDTRRPVRALSRMLVSDGVIYGATAQSADGGESIFEWRRGEWRSRLYPGIVVDAWGAVSTFEGESFAVSGGQIIAAAGPVPGYFTIRTEYDQRQHLFVDRKLDGTLVTATYPLRAESGRVALLASFGPKTEGLYANLPWVLQMERTGNSLRLEVPAGHFLETSDHPSGPWRQIPATPTFQVPASAPSGYYRLREP